MDKRTMHLSLGYGFAVACGAETSWRTRGYQAVDLRRDKSTAVTDCKRCKNTAAFMRRLGNGE